MPIDLVSLLAAISHQSLASTATPTYAVRPIPGRAGHYFGRDAMGAPCLLLAAADQLKAHHTPIRLTGLDVQFAIDCKVTFPDSTEHSRLLTVIVCKSMEEETQAYFCHVCESILDILGLNPPMKKIAEVVRRLVDLFQKLTQPASRAVSGLFGELLIVSIAHNPLVTLEAWRSSSDNRFDFSFDSVRMEVKVTSTRTRVHSFSLDQCCPPSGTTGILASMFVEVVGGGLSLRELAERIQKLIAVDADLVFKLHDTIAHTLGSSINVSLGTRFDEQLATSSLRFFDLREVPAIRPPLPQDVSMVRFQSDLSTIAPLSIHELIKRNSIATELLPER